MSKSKNIKKAYKNQRHSIKPQGYDYFTDDGGESYAVDKKTGEAIAANVVILPEGSKVYTPQSQEEYKRKKEFANYRNGLKQSLGHFYFTNDNISAEGLKPATIARLIFLNSYLSYNSNQLMLTRRTPMKKSDLPSVLKISNSSVTDFLSEVSPEFITIDSDNNLFSNDQMFKKGRIGVNADFNTYRKIYINSIRKLYNSTKTSQHKHLGYVFQLLPYINLEYNVLCENIDETDFNEIKPLTLKDFCERIGFDYTKVSRLLKIYKEITFDVDNEKQQFLCLVSDGLKYDNALLYINPKVIYNGKSYYKVDWTQIFFDRHKEKDTGDKPKIPMKDLD